MPLPWLAVHPKIDVRAESSTTSAVDLNSHQAVGLQGMDGVARQSALVLCESSVNNCAQRWIRQECGR